MLAPVVEGLTVERAGELFAGLLPAPGPVRAVSRFAEGSVTGAYRIEFAGADPAPVVLKIYDAGSLRFAVKEARALRFLTGHGVDISPQVLAFSRSACSNATCAGSAATPPTRPWPTSSPRTSPGTPPRSPNAPGLPTATATCMRPTCWQSSPGTAPAR